MSKVELSVPRSDDFDAASLERIGGDWPVARPPGAPRPYDEDALFELAATWRGADVNWWHIHLYLTPTVNASEPMGERERRVWFSVLSDHAFTHAESREAALEGLRERSAEVVAGWSLERVMATLRGVDVDTSRRASVEFEDWFLHGALLRHELPWSDTLEALEAHAPPGALCALAAGLGPCPVAERERASALTGRLVSAVAATSSSARYRQHHVYGLLQVAPNQEVITSLVDAAVASSSNPEHEHVSAMLRTDTFSDVERLLKTRRVTLSGSHIRRVYARWGIQGVTLMLTTGLTTRRSKVWGEVFSTFMKIHAPEVIEGAFAYCAEGTASAALMREYIDGAPAEHVAHGLIACCSRAGKRRTWAVDELRALTRREGGAQALEDALSQWKKATRDFVRAQVLDHEDAQARATIQELEGWAVALVEASARFEAPCWLGEAELAPLITLEGQALPDACTRGVLCRDLEEATDAASARSFDEVLSGWFTAESLGALSLELMSRWNAAPRYADRREDGRVETRLVHARPIDWLGRFPSPAGVAALEGYLRTKRPPNRPADPDAFMIHAAKTMVGIDTVEGLAATLRLEETGRVNVKYIGERAVKAQTKRRGVTRAELCHLAIPSFGLDARGERDFDYGPRTIRLRVRGDAIEYEDLSVGKVSSRAPKGRRKDDVDLVAAAAAQIALTHKPLAAELKRHVVAFEEDMVCRTNWKPGHWREHIVGHPLLGAMATRLVWRIKPSGSLPWFARPTADGSLLDVELEEVPWPEGKAVVRVAHPLELREALQPWSEHVASFELTQPFDQLGRALHTFDEADQEMLADLQGRRAHLSPKLLRKLLGARAGKLVETSYYGDVTSTYELTDKLVFRLSRTQNDSRTEPLRMLHARYRGDVLDVDGQGARSWAKLERVLRSEALRVLRSALIQE